jgi:hypothetical protein
MAVSATVALLWTLAPVSNVGHCRQATAPEAAPQPQAPEIPGEFRPAVGSGAEYAVTDAHGKDTWVIAVVAKEQVEGHEGFWLETRMEGDEGNYAMKRLVVMQPGGPRAVRSIVEFPGRPPLDLALTRPAPGAEFSPAVSLGKEEELGEEVGDETVRVPAGTFLCDHHRKTGPAGTMDIWISEKVLPYGLVKMTTADMTVVLEKLLKHQTSHIRNGGRVR